jgi:hypothetical protein
MTNTKPQPKPQQHDKRHKTKIQVEEGNNSMASEASTEQRRREACLTIPKAELHLHIEVLTN